MKRLIKIAGLCLASTFVMGMALAGTAQAKWEQCATEKAAAAATKYETNQCLKVQSGGKWAWQEVTGTEEVRIKGSLKLTTTGVPIVGTVAVECSGESVGAVGPGQLGRITSVSTSAAQCRNIENCEKIEEAEA